MGGSPKQAEVMRAARRRRVTKCVRCGFPFEHLDKKAMTCPTCKQPHPCLCGCGRLTRADYAQGHSPRQRSSEAHAKQARAISGDANPAKRDDVRRRISERLLQSHPAHDPKWRQKFQEHANDMRRDRVSVLEYQFIPLLPTFVHQLRVDWKRLDFGRRADQIDIEIMGCWWHACSRCYPRGATTKRQRDAVANDLKRNAYLRGRGWTVVEVWQHDIDTHGPKRALEIALEVAGVVQHLSDL